MLQGLTLALSCLSFDFVGTCLDDSAEDMSTIQVTKQTSQQLMHCNLRAKGTLH
jgi:hypothetical protein